MPSLTRREALTSSAAAGCLLLTRQGRAAPQAAVESIRTISYQPQRYHGWPTLAKRKNGELMLVCSGGRESHVCPFGRVEWMKSQDQGATWSYPRVLHDGPIDDRDAGVVETPKGAILVTSFTSLAYEPRLQAMEKANDQEDLRRWQAVHRRLSDSDRREQLGVWMLRSTDGGLSWSAPYRCLVNSPHGPIALRNGSLLYAGKALWADNRVGVCVSNDDGLTWNWMAEIAPRDGDDPNKYHELHAVEAHSGRLVAHIRNHNAVNSGETLQCHSDDGGKTWSQPYAIGVWGLPSHLLRLEDGRLLMSYGHRRKPFGNQARLSEDEGRHWSEPFAISDDGGGGDLGYPSTVQFGDRFVTVWYELRPGTKYAVLRQATWRLA